jgi:general secretion pathway protein A
MLQIILAGQPELDRKLEDRELRQLKQRIALRCHLKPLTAQETAEYVGARLARAGMRDQTVFSTEVLNEIHHPTQGIPRLINAVCDNMMLTSFAMESHQANIKMLDEVSRDLHLEWPGASRVYPTGGDTPLQ